jgi:H+/Cl- antiporter ClcA
VGSACVVIALTQLLGTDAYLGIGVTGRLPGDPSLVRCFEVGGVTDWSWGWKLLFTTVTLAGGFKGGEVTPLFFVGAALGHTLATFAGWPVQEFAALGFVAVFAAASHTPLACAVLGWELFGPEILLPALLACLVANAVATGTGLYDARTQSDKASQ